MRFRPPHPTGGGVTLSRRHFLAATGGTALALCLPACGGSGGGPAAPAATLVTRTEPTGDLQNQVNQYSKSIEDFSETMRGLPDVLANLDARTRRSREDDELRPAEDYFLAIFAGLDAIKEVHDRVTLAAVKLDDMAYLADKTSTGYGLDAENSLKNPQWMGAMLDRNYHIMLLLGLYSETLQTAFIPQFLQAINTQPDLDGQILMYALFVNRFNLWVSRVAALANTTVKPEWVLSVPETMVQGQAPVLLQNVPAIVRDLPYGPGPRPATTREADLGTVLSAEGSFVGAVGEVFWGESQTASQWISNPTLSRADAIRNLKQFGPDVLKGAAKGFAVDYAVGKMADGLQGAVGGTSGAIAGCAVRVGKGLFDVGTSAAAMVGTSVTGVGLVVWGAKLGFDGAQLGMSVNQCFDDYYDARNKECVTLASEKVEQSFKPDGSVPPAQRVPAEKLKNLECDQLANLKLQRKKPCLTRGQFPDIEDWRTIEPTTARGDLLGGATTRAGRPRSYRETENAAAGLMRDYGQRNQADTQFTVNAEGMEFIGSDFAMLVRREAETDGAPIPALTSASIMCTAQGSVPKRSGPGGMDLTKMPSFPKLRPLTELGKGVIVDVS